MCGSKDKSSTSQTVADSLTIDGGSESPADESPPLPPPLPPPPPPPLMPLPLPLPTAQTVSNTYSLHCDTLANTNNQPSLLSQSVIQTGYPNCTIPFVPFVPLPLLSMNQHHQLIPSASQAFNVALPSNPQPIDLSVSAAYSKPAEPFYGPRVEYDANNKENSDYTPLSLGKFMYTL